jgi:hypothetical protein
MLSWQRLRQHVSATSNGDRVAATILFCDLVDDRQFFMYPFYQKLVFSQHDGRYGDRHLGWGDGECGERLFSRLCSHGSDVSAMPRRGDPIRRPWKRDFGSVGSVGGVGGVGRQRMPLLAS